MAGSTRGELPSSGLEGSVITAAYQNGQRGAYSASSLERAGSFRETLDARSLVSGTGTPRNVVSPMELSPVSSYLSLEPFFVGEQKYSRQGELRRALGITNEEHAFGTVQSKTIPHFSLEDVKRLKVSLTESMGKARDRAKTFHESIVKMDKYRNMLLRKRKADQLTEKLSSSNILKIGGQNHPAELATQRLDERTKNVVPNKRVRSSMAEVRAEGRSVGPSRQGAVVEKEKIVLFDKDKNTLRGCNGLTDEKMRGLPQLKRKRSVGTMVNRGIDGDREVKSPSQQRPNNDPRQRSSDGNGFKPGPSSGIIGSNKIEGNCSTGANTRIGPRGDLECSSLSSEKRERSAGIDKERVISKGGNKITIREDAQLGNQSPLIKGKASRAPRSASGVLMNTSTSLSHSVGGLDGWEQASCLNKVQALPGVTNRKRPVPTRSSSPPVTQWIGQRPQKISRTRRANVVSPVSNLDESQFLPDGFGMPDVGRLTNTDSSGQLISKSMPTTTHQSKLKLESVPSPSGLSESEDSGAVENKYKEKGVNNDELEDTSLNASNKSTSFMFPTKKNKVLIKEDFGDEVRRQGRIGRGLTQSKLSLPSPKEKTEVLDTTKPLKNGKMGSDRNESRIGRPPSKKMSDRKTHTRTGNIINGVLSDLTGDSADDREELQAAALAVRNATYSASSVFWKKMEPYFAFLTPEDASYVKNQIHFAEELDSSLSDKSCADHDGEVISEGISSPRSSFLIGQVQTNATGTNRSTGPVSDGPRIMQTEAGNSGTNRLCEKIIPLSQLLISALITQDETEGVDYGCEAETFSQLSNDYLSFGTNSGHTENENSRNLTKSEFEVNLSYTKHLEDYTPCNGFMNSSNSRHPKTPTLMSGDESLTENSSVMHSDNGYISKYRYTNINMQRQADSITLHDCQFEHMSLNDRILLELHSIGLYPEAVPELAEDGTGEIDREIAELKMKLCHQVKRKRFQLDKLGKAIKSAKEMEERNLEVLAVNKLVEMACKKLMCGRGGSSHKSNKIAKQLAISFANRTLTRCQKFEETGQSCFREPALWDVLTAADNNHHHGVASTNTNKHGLGNKLDRGSMDSHKSQIPDQSLVKNELILNRGKKMEVLLDDVAGGASRSMSTPNTIPSGAKWKRTERDRDHHREGSTRNSSVKVGRPSMSNSRGERKTKTKPRQKIAELSASGNGLGRITETTDFASPSLQECNETVNNVINQEADVTRDSSKEIHESVFTNLPLHGLDSIDELDVDDGLGGQGQDLASWLNFDDDVLLQDDLVGLEIPMDDLSDIKLGF